MFGFIVILIAVVAVIAFVAAHTVTVPPSEALIVSGSQKDGSTKIVMPGGRTFLIPIIQSARSVSLVQQPIGLQVTGVDENSVEVRVAAVAIVKVEGDAASIRAAAERFPEVTHGDDGTSMIASNTQQILTGALRSIVATMTIKELISDRQRLQEQVLDAAKAELKPMGLIIETLTINDIDDQQGYIANLGVPETERVRKDAEVAKAVNAREANKARTESEAAIAEQNRDLAIQQAKMKAETDQQLAVSNAAGPLAKAEQDRKIAQIEQETAMAQAELREKQLDIEVRKPADAKRYEVEVAADAEKTKAIREAEAAKESTIRSAEADAEKRKLEAAAAAAAAKQTAEADAAATRARATAEADAVRARGEAEAAAVKARGEAEANTTRARGEAEADAMSKQADAYAKYNDAAKLQIVAQILPEIAKALAEPMGNIKDMTVISPDGASNISRQVANGFPQLDAVLKSTTGTSLRELVGNIADRVANGSLPSSDAAIPDRPDTGMDD